MAGVRKQTIGFRVVGNADHGLTPVLLGGGFSNNVKGQTLGESAALVAWPLVHFRSPQ